MANLTNSAFRLVSGWTLTRLITGAKPVTQQDTISVVPTLDPAITNALVLTPFTIAAGANVDVDLSAFTDLAGNAVSGITKAATMVVKATATVAGGQLRIKPSASNGLTWFFGGSTQSITLNVGAGLLCGIALYDGVNATVASGTKGINLSNPGTQDIVVSAEWKLG